jgi:ribonuclease III
MTSMNNMEHLIKKIEEIEKKIDYIFLDRSLLMLAFVHRSFLNENKLTREHNERLEFLGDAVLGLIISHYLYTTLPDIPEGDLSYLRSRLVEASSCVHYIQKLDLDSYILLGKGERRNAGRGRTSILADLFEAVVGAIFLDRGLQAVESFLFNHFSKDFEKIIKTPLRNWKAMLQDYSQKKYQQTPFYQLEEASGPDHSKLFEISVFINNEKIGTGKGASKKEAQQAAAQDAAVRCNIPEIEEK